MTYDDREARWILAKAAGELLPTLKGRDDAGRELLKDFVDMMNSCDGFGAEFVHGRRDAAHVVVPRVVEVWVTHVGEGRFLLKGENGESKEVRLVYDLEKQQLAGAEDDTRVVPMPGEPRAVRSALAVLTEAAVALMVKPGTQSESG
jgi:hypothetical protein